MANEKTSLVGLNILGPGSYYNWPDRNADNQAIDEYAKLLTDFDNLKSRMEYNFTEEVIGQTADGQDLYRFTTTVLNPDGTTLATRVTTEVEGAGPGLYVFDTVTTIDGVAYHERYAENANGGTNREVVV